MTVRISYVKYNLKLSIGEKIVSDIVIIYNIMLAEQYYIHVLYHIIIGTIHSPIFTMPWLVSSQHECSLSADRLLDCLDEKNPKAASVTWYACSVNSLRAGSIWATAPTASSATFMQSLRVSDTILGVKHAHRPASVISLHPTSSSCQTPCAINNIIVITKVWRQPSSYIRQTVIII